jgi:predicted RNA binding protein YcfA (HicA-like mRNA interferase family)
MNLRNAIWWSVSIPRCESLASLKAKKAYRALLRIGWNPKSEKGSSHLQLQRSGFADYTWSFQDSDEIGPKMMARIAKHTGLRREDL